MRTGAQDDLVGFDPELLAAAFGDDSCRACAVEQDASDLDLSPDG